MEVSKIDYAHLKEFIYSAVESEQESPSDFKPETEKRLDLVFNKLNRMLGLPEDYDSDY